MIPTRQLAFLGVALLYATLAVQSFGQEAVEHLGLDQKQATSISLYGGVIAVGTDGNGVYWQAAFTPTDSGWTHIPLDSQSVQTVYAHKSGPIGWAIGAGVAPQKPNSPFIYCSFMGGAFVAQSHGIDNSVTSRITSLDGFPDPTICGETYAAGDRALYRRTFGDSTWRPIFDTTIEGNIQTVVAREEYPGVVIAGGAEGFAGHLLQKSTDFGDRWEDVSPIATVYSVDFAGLEAEVIFAATGERIHRSTNGGSTWDVVLNGLGNYFLNHVLYDPVSTSVFASAIVVNDTPILFFSTDNGERWEPFSLPVNGNVVDLEFGAGADWIYFVTRDEGVFRIERKLISVGVDQNHDVPGTAYLDQNFPNPFAGSTTIRYTVSEPTTVQLEIYSVLGKRVATWRKQRLTVGSHTVTWDASESASGVYLYTIRTPSGSHTQKLMVVK
jgi:hypothetical protein